MRMTSSPPEVANLLHETIDSGDSDRKQLTIYNECVFAYASTTARRCENNDKNATNTMYTCGKKEEKMSPRRRRQAAARI